MPDTVDEVADRLYGLPLEEFTRERDAAAKALRKEKLRDEAAVVGKLPKPSQASWAANHLAREQRKLVDELLAAGDALREAQEAAMSGGGAKALREAGAAERAAVEALVDAARELEPGGRKPTETTLERLRTTLHAAAGDDDVRAALDAGRLVEDAEGATAWGLLAALGGDEEPQGATKGDSQRGAAKGGATKGGAAKGGAAKGGAAKGGEAKGGAAKGGAAKGGAAKAGGAAKPAKKTAADREAEKRAAAEEREARKAAEKEAKERRAALEAELKEARAERKAREREAGRAERDAQRAARRLEDALAAAEDAREEAEDAKTEAVAMKERAAAAADAVARLEEQLD